MIRERERGSKKICEREGLGLCELFILSFYKIDEIDARDIIDIL